MDNEGWKSALSGEGQAYDGEMVECRWRIESEARICSLLGIQGVADVLRHGRLNVPVFAVSDNMAIWQTKIIWVSGV